MDAKMITDVNVSLSSLKIDMSSCHIRTFRMLNFKKLICGRSPEVRGRRRPGHSRLCKKTHLGKTATEPKKGTQSPYLKVYFQSHGIEIKVLYLHCLGGVQTIKQFSPDPYKRRLHVLQHSHIWRSRNVFEI